MSDESDQDEDTSMSEFLNTFQNKIETESTKSDLVSFLKLQKVLLQYPVGRKNLDNELSENDQFGTSFFRNLCRSAKSKIQKYEYPYDGKQIGLNM